jgi:hypothetical protein
MRYCPENITITDVWVNHGVSECFMDTFSYSSVSVYLFIFGSLQIWMYQRYGSRVSDLSLPKSSLYMLQLTLTFLLSVIALVRFGLQVFLYNNGVIYGYMVSNNNSLQQ